MRTIALHEHKLGGALLQGHVWTKQDAESAKVFEQEFKFTIRDGEDPGGSYELARPPSGKWTWFIELPGKQAPSVVDKEYAIRFAGCYAIGVLTHLVGDTYEFTFDSITLFGDLMGEDSR